MKIKMYVVRAVCKLGGYSMEVHFPANKSLAGRFQMALTCGQWALTPAMASFGMTASAFKLEMRSYWATKPEQAQLRGHGHGSEHVRFNWAFPLKWGKRYEEALTATSWLNVAD